MYITCLYKVGSPQPYHVTCSTKLTNFSSLKKQLLLLLFYKMLLHVLTICSDNSVNTSCDQLFASETEWHGNHSFLLLKKGFFILQRLKIIKWGRNLMIIVISKIYICKKKKVFNFYKPYKQGWKKYYSNKRTSIQQKHIAFLQSYSVYFTLSIMPHLGPIKVLEHTDVIKLEL